VSPESLQGPLVGVGRQQQRRPLEGLVDVLDDDERLGDGPVAVEEHRHLLVHRVVLEEQRALVAQVL
jgi:hypothetical protein